MSFPSKFNRSQLDAIEQLEFRIKDGFPSDMNDDGTLFHRFLKATDFDVDKAEEMLRKNISWRKAFQVDTILDTFKPKEVFLKYIGTSFIGFDKEGGPIVYGSLGRVEGRDVANSMKLNDSMKHHIWRVEQAIRLLKLDCLKTGRSAYQGIFIADFYGLTFANATSGVVKDVMLRVTHLLQDNYPERMKYLYVINAPAFFAVIFTVLKRVMSSAMLKKMHVFGQNGWKEALLEVIDADVLPAFLGGKRTDPNGDPFCRTIVMTGGRIPPEYFLSEEERRFKGGCKVERVVVPSGSDHKIMLDVKVRHSVIRWEFETKRKDIGFGLFYQLSEKELEEVLPIQRIVTCDGTETGLFQSHLKGIYVIVFDNSHSWFYSKEVFYSITVENLNSLHN